MHVSRQTEKPSVKLVVSVDVEEEGLFGGQYAREATAANVTHLKRLDFCPREFGVPLTLLAAWSVTQSPAACEAILRHKEDYGAAVGAHLHHWNTPPLRELPYPDPVPSALVPHDLMRDKLLQLCDTINDRFGTPPRSFRMGRFDWCDSLAPLLEEAGIRVDSSMVPLRTEIGLDRPDHFRFRARPWQITPSLLEVPLTADSIADFFAKGADRLGTLLPEKARRRLLRDYSRVAVVGIAPLWFPLASMKLATWLHLARGGRVLNMFLHSSELMPGGSPKVPDEAAANKLAKKIGTYMAWLHTVCDVQGTTLDAVAE